MTVPATRATILFVTTTNPIVNPRLRKEMELAIAHGFNCELVYFKLGTWSDPLSMKYIASSRIKACLLDATKNSFILWLASTFVQKTSSFFHSFPGSVKHTAFETDKRSWIIHRFLKKKHAEYALLIAHNPGAFFPVYRYAQKNNIPFAIDVEDYHPGETKDANIRKKLEYLMEIILPHPVYTSFASPLIMQYSQKLIGINTQSQFVVKNSFPKEDFSYVSNDNKTDATADPVRLVWFSQKISFGRGLESIIEALKGIPERFELHLIGNLFEPFNEKWIKPNKRYITVHKPMKQAELHKLLSEFDIGLALENALSNINRDICLTNKIFAYAQSGLYILATNTKAQEEFIMENQWSGMLCGSSVQEMQNALKEITEGVDKIREGKIARFEAAKPLSWENESDKLLDTWKEL